MKNGIPNDEEFNDYFASDDKLTTREKIEIAVIVLVWVGLWYGIIRLLTKILL